MTRTVLVLGVWLVALGCTTSAATPAPSSALPASLTATTAATPTNPPASVAPTATLAASVVPTTVPIITPGPSATPAPTPPASSATGGISGHWTGTWTNSPDFGKPPATGGLKVDIVQTGNTFTGNATIDGSTCDTGGASNGTVTGNEITFGWQSDPQRPVQFEGTIDGDKMSGTWTAIACAPANIPIYGTWELSRSAQ